MNDFLQSLRSGSLKPQRQNSVRKTHDYTYHSANQQYQYYSSTQNNAYPAEFHSESSEYKEESYPVLLTGLEDLSRQLQRLAQNQQQMIETQERTAAVMERQAVAIEKIMRRFMVSQGV